MPSRLLPRTDEEIIAALTAAKTKNDTLTEGHEVLNSATATRLDADEPDFAAKLLARGIALRNQGSSTSDLDSKRDRAKLFISHFFQAFNNGVMRGVFPAADRAYYQLDTNSSAVPVLNNEESIITWGNRIQVGDPARTTAGGIVMANPSLAEFNTVFNAYKTAKGTHSTLKDTYDESQQAVADMRAEVNDLILHIWNEVETYYSSEDPSNKRRKCREWGIIYINVPDEDSLTGTVTDTNGNPVQGAVINIEQLSVSASSNSSGQYNIPTVVAGTYTITVTKIGFQTRSIPNIVINAGIVTPLDIQLLSLIHI